MLIGCIADDLTGATDLGVNLAREGLAVVQVNGVPPADLALPQVDAVVVALKSRTIAAADAVAQSLAAHAWLRAHGARRIYFKYCSTFDSTPHGNIGPVTEALAAAAGAGIVPATPAYPRNQRTVYRGHLFVGDLLLSETGMREHPLTPMTDANLVRVLGAQSTRRVGLVAAETLDAGADAVRTRLAALERDGCGHAIVDATRDERAARPGARTHPVGLHPLVEVVEHDTHRLLGREIEQRLGEALCLAAQRHREVGRDLLALRELLEPPVRVAGVPHPQRLPSARQVVELAAFGRLPDGPVDRGLVGLHVASPSGLLTAR